MFAYEYYVFLCAECQLFFFNLEYFLFSYAESEFAMDLDMIEIGKRIRQRRKELGFSQTDIYDKCDITSGALSKIENGKITPSVVAFFKLSEILECDMNWLATGNSSHLQNSKECDQENLLLNGFKQLSADDQSELLEILQMKLRKQERLHGNNSST